MIYLYHILKAVVSSQHWAMLHYIRIINIWGVRNKIGLAAIH